MSTAMYANASRLSIAWRQATSGSSISHNTAKRKIEMAEEKRKRERERAVDSN